MLALLALLACSPPQRLAPVSATAWGDPHMLTVSGDYYSFQATGAFVLLRSADRALEVQALLAPLGTSRQVSVIQAIATHTGGHRITLDADRPEPLWINGVPSPLAVGETHASVARTHPETWVIHTPDGSRVRVSDFAGLAVRIDLSPGAADARGLLGREPPLAATQPQTAQDPLYADFARRWRLAAGSLLDTPLDAAELDYPARAGFPPDTVRAVQACAGAGVLGSLARKSCMFDVSISGDHRLAGAYALLSGELPQAPARYLTPADQSQLSP